MFLIELLSVSGGAIIGALGRHFLTLLIDNRVKVLGNYNVSRLHLGTATVNITGSFIIGIVSALAVDLKLNDNLKLFLLPGILASFTTFASFSLFEIQFLKDQKFIHWLIFILLNVVGSSIFVFLGLIIGHKLSSKIAKNLSSEEDVLKLYF